MDIMDLCIGGQVQDLPLQGVYLFFDFTINIRYAHCMSMRGWETLGETPKQKPSTRSASAFADNIAYQSYHGGSNNQEIEKTLTPPDSSPTAICCSFGAQTRLVTPAVRAAS